jgi:hypothetical protein
VVVAALLAATALALALVLTTVQLGVVAVPLIGAALLVVPWLLQDPFRLYLWLIVTWPIGMLYATMPLPAGLPDVTYERVLVPVNVALVIILAVLRRERLPRLGLLASVYLLLKAWSVAHGLWFGGVAKPDVAGFVNFLILPLMMYWLGKDLISSPWHLRRLIAALLVVVSIGGATGIYERVIDAPDSPFPISPHNAAGDTRYGGVPGGRAAGILQNPAVYGAIMGVGILAALCFFAHTTSLPRRFGYGLWAGLLGYCAYVSYTRSVWLSVAIALLIAPLMINDLWKKIIPLSLVSVMVVLLAWGTLSESQIFQDRVMEKENVTGRFARITWSVQRYLEKPILGWGSESLDALMTREFAADGFDTSHNTYLTMLVDGGTFLLLAFMAQALAWLRQALVVARSLDKHRFERSACGVMLGCLLLYLLSGMAVELRYFGFFTAMFWIAGAAIERTYAWSLSQDQEAATAGSIP